MNTPLVSIIIPTFNRAHLIGETLDSVLAQTYTHWECIVVDDGSTDATAELLADYCKKDVRFQYHHRPTNRRKGANACRNYGFELSKGNYINWLDSDDLLSKNKLENQLDEVKDDIDIITCKWSVKQGDILIDKKNETYKNYHNGINLLNDFGKYDTYFPIHAYLIKRQLILISGNWDERLRINQDGELIARLLNKCEKIAFSKNSFVVYFKNESEVSVSSYTNAKLNDLVFTWKIIEKNLNNSNALASSYLAFFKFKIFKLMLHRDKWILIKNFYFFRKQFLRKIQIIIKAKIAAYFHEK